jgi:hypothetical protein
MIKESPTPWHVIGELELVGLLTGHARLRRLCGDLERIADRLPAVPDRTTIDRVCGQLEQFLARHQQDELKLIDWLFGRDTSRLAAGLIATIRAQHLTDRMQAEDLAEALRTVEAGPTANVSGLAYMLRCFFDGCRRAMIFEELAILSLAGNRLDKDAREALTASLVRDGS